ncbi:MAG: acyl-ACP--UDP-N-acetylglucosamine O-acyltransferase [Phycisphaerales bacterium]|nr:acyl-ACP--UDP-N-acetylglucosamine O-acyltransferase [Phycisphaerales bacterium]
MNIEEVSRRGTELSQIHPSAYVDSKAEIGRNVVIGPHCYVGAGAVLGDDCLLHNNVTIADRTICGRANVFFPQTVVGVAPQDLKYRGEPTRLEMGDDNVFRENVTVHAGTEVAGGLTRIGSHNRFLVGVHIAHDAVIGNDCILSNYVQLAGHVCLEDKVTMSALIGVHHFTTIGTLAYVGGLTRIVADVPPFMIVEGNPSRVRGYNETGLRRWGYADVQIRSVREAYRMLFSSRAESFGSSMLERIASLESRPEVNGEVRYLCESVRRSLHEGVFGRQLESHRRDTEADRRTFYRREGENRD